MAHQILLVDDSNTTKTVITKALNLSGIDLGTIFKAANGREGLDLLQKEKIDLVFLDINMPIMGGMEMLDEMKKNPSLSSIPVVVISTEGSSTRIEELKSKGVAAFLRKPFLPEVLKQTVESILGVSHA